MAKDATSLGVFSGVEIRAVSFQGSTTDGHLLIMLTSHSVEIVIVTTMMMLPTSSKAAAASKE
jgi:hypothetical protein